MRHIDLFSGIGGFALAAERVYGSDVEHVFCDNEPFAQAVLRKHWPDAKIYDDIKNFNYEPADIITGGFPCQPFSAAGLRRGTEDDRHLWPEMLRVIRLSSPRWVVGENVGGLLTWNGGMVLDQVCVDLEGAGYQVWPFVLPAASVGAPHLRNRVWIVANRVSDATGSAHGRTFGVGEFGRQESHEQEGRKVRSNFADRDTQRGEDFVGDTEGGGDRRHQREVVEEAQLGGTGQLGHHGFDAAWRENWLEVATRLCRMDDGIPRRLDRTPRLKALGNAIVPQVAEEIFKAIKDVEAQTK